MKEMNKISFEVEGEIIPKRRPRWGRTHMYTPAATKSYEELIGHLGKAAFMNASQDMFAEEVGVLIEIHLEPPTRWNEEKTHDALSGKILPVTTRKDIDNVVKSVLDGLNKIAYKDDKQICDLMAYKRYGQKEKIKITIWGKKC